MSTEVLIVLGLYAFHVYDAALLLKPREMVLSCGSGRHALAAPYPYLAVRGGVPWLPNPCRPDRLLFRLTWGDDRVGRASLADAQALAVAARPLAAPTIALAATLLIGLPWIALTRGIGPDFLVGLGVVYALIAALLATTWAKRSALGLARRDVLAIAFDALACPPFAIDLMRKLGLRRALDIDPLALVAALPRADAAVVWRTMRRHLDDELAALHDERGAQATRLRAFAARLEAELA